MNVKVSLVEFYREEDQFQPGWSWWDSRCRWGSENTPSCPDEPSKVAAKSSNTKQFSTSLGNQELQSPQDDQQKGRPTLIESRCELFK